MPISPQAVDRIDAELQALNHEFSDLDKFFHLETDPPHVLFNLICPEE